MIKGRILRKACDQAVQYLDPIQSHLLAAFTPGTVGMTVLIV